MARHEVIPISQIVVPSTQDPERARRGDTAALAGWLSRNDTEILVDEKYTLLDGARRLYLLQLAHLDRVRVYVAETAAEAFDYLEKAREQGNQEQWDARRTWDLQMAMTHLRNKHYILTRRGRGKGRRPEGVRHDDVEHHARRGIARACGRSEGWIQSLFFVYSRHYGLIDMDPRYKELAADLARQLDHGGNTYGLVRLLKTAMDEGRRMEGKATGLGDQRLLLNGMAASLRTAVRALNELGPLHRSLSDADIASWATEVDNARTALFAASRKFKERVEKADGK